MSKIIISCLIIFIVLTLILLPNISLAKQGDVCSPDGYSVVFVNGINTSDTEARNNMIALAKIGDFEFKNQEIYYKYLYNPTHTAGLSDFLDVASQKLFEKMGSDDYDFVEIWKDASQKVNTQKLLLVAHSQGNFYANTFYETLAGRVGGVPAQSIGVYGVASPASHVAGGGKYVTSSTDKVINSLRIGSLFKVLPANIDIKLSAGDDFNGHSFSDVYLKYQSSKIVTEIKSTLGVLSSNGIQIPSLPCISAPDPDFAHSVAGAMFSITDPVANATKASTIYVAVGSYNVLTVVGNGTMTGVTATTLFGYNTLSFLGNSVLNGVSAVVSTVSSVAKSINNNVQNLGQVNASVAMLANIPDENLEVINVVNETNEIIPPIVIEKKKDVIKIVEIVQKVDAPIILEEIKKVEIIVPIVPVIIVPIVLQGGPTTYPPSAMPPSDPPPIVEEIIVIPPPEVLVEIIPEIVPEIIPEPVIVPLYNVADFATSDLNVNGIADISEDEVVVALNASLPAGSYAFHNLIISNNAILTLQGDPASSNAFKGVKIVAVNFNINSGSTIYADQQGYLANTGIGVSAVNTIGASYGGKSYSGSTLSTYGSATLPTDLGSGGNSTRGGGAIKIIVSNIFTNDGIVTSNAGLAGSGGSIYVDTRDLLGAGTFRANGGNLFVGGFFKSPGGGGRVAVYYKTSVFSGTTEAKGGCGRYDGFSLSCGDAGTVGLFNTTLNDIYLNSTWKFLQTDAPFSYHNIFISNTGAVTSADGVIINADSILINGSASFVLSENQILNIPSITLAGASVLTLSGSETINTNTFNLNDTAVLTVASLKVLALTVPILNISAGASINSDKKGYGFSASIPLGPGASDAPYNPLDTRLYYMGPSHGGLGYQSDISFIYGSATEPDTFGSGSMHVTINTSRGGGVVRLIVSDTFTNNGLVSANGGESSSGGSVYITSNNLLGSGTFSANGGRAYCSGTCHGAGGGGRVALHYITNSFTGSATSSGWTGNSGGSPSLAGSVERIQD